MHTTTVPVRHAVRQEVPGIVNLARIEATVACAGDTKPEAIAGLKQMGFASIINVRPANEAGANVDAQAAAATSAGITFFHVPFSGASPDPAAAGRFLEVMASPGVEPACICCASGNRAAALWMIKRIVIDRWPVDRAAGEAADLGLTSPTLAQFAIDYAAGRTA